MIVDIRYENPGDIPYDVIEYYVDGQPYVQGPSGCVKGASCIGAIDLAEGAHDIQARAFSVQAQQWSVLSNTIVKTGAPEPGLGSMLACGALVLAAACRARRRA